MDSIEGLAVALLAAGRSTRFGSADKLTSLLGGKPLIEWAAGAGRTMNAAQHFIVTDPDFSEQNCPCDYTQLRNPDAAEGLGSSLRVAARQARETGASALLILLGDMPLVRPDHLAALLARFARDPLRPVFSRAPGGALQPPVVFPAALFPVLEALGGDSGARSLSRDAVFVETATDSLIDVDTPADLARCVWLIKV